MVGRDGFVSGTESFSISSLMGWVVDEEDEEEDGCDRE